MAAVEPVRVLFICIGNTCRSPMAEAMAQAMGGGRLVAASAGVAPTGRVAPLTRATLESLGYSSAGLRSKGLDEVPLQACDLIVSLAGEEGLRFLPAVAGRTRAWRIPDPFGEEEDVYLAVARLIERRVRALVAEIDQMEPGAG